MRSLFVFMSVIVMTLLISCGEQEEPVPDPTASPSPTPEVAAATPPGATTPPWPTPPADLTQRIDACIGDVPDAQQAVNALEECPSLQEIGSRATAAEGDSPVVLLDVGRGCTHYTESFVLWRDDADWQIQSAEPLLSDSRESRDHGRTLVGGAWRYGPTDGSLATGPTARVAANGIVTRLGIIYGQAGCGSGPHASYLLLSLEADGWKPKWDAETTRFGGLGHTTVEFTGEGIDELTVKGSSWFRPDNVFGESNAGPHRFFEQRWVREADTYAMTVEQVLPSAYATLHDFIRRLGSGDEVGAAGLVSDVSVVGTAQDFGLAKGTSDPLWHGYCTDGTEYASGSLAAPGPCVVERPDGQRFRFHVVERGGDWLISAIEPVTP